MTGEIRFANTDSERPVYHRLLHRSNKISAITAMSTDGIIALELFQKTLNGHRFLD